MEYTGFLTLRVRIEALTEGRYRATVEGGEREAQSVPFTLPFTPDERAALLAQVRAPFGYDPEQPDRWQTLKELGTTLFNAIFQEETLVTWRLLHKETESKSLLLRLVLDIGPDELQPLPWEALFDPIERFFLTRDPHTCLIRYPRDTTKLSLSVPSAPLRILALISLPEGAGSLNVEAEKQLLSTTLNELIEQKLVELHWIDGRDEPATLERLALELNRAAEAGSPYHIFHYIGHAGWDPARGEGVLLLEDEQGKPAPTTALAIGELLRGDKLHLAVLNACEGGRVDEGDHFRSVAAALIFGADLPAVVANQVRISDAAARAFADNFYSALAQHKSVEEGVVAARHAMSLTLTHNAEWVATVFFSRYAQQPLFLLPRSRLRAGQPWLTAALLFVLTTILGVTVVSLFRTMGLAVGGAFQLAVWAIAGWYAFDQRAHLLRNRVYVGGALALATVAVGAWFLYQPTLHVSAPPPAFGLTLDSPSPYVFQEEQIPIVNYSVSVQGHAIEVPEGHSIWILVQVENSGTYTVGDQTFFLDDGEHFVANEVVVGPPVIRRVNNRRYTLQPLLVDAEGARFLQRHHGAFWRFFHPDFRIVPQPRLQSALVIRR